MSLLVILLIVIVLVAVLGGGGRYYSGRRGLSGSGGISPATDDHPHRVDHRVPVRRHRLLHALTRTHAWPVVSLSRGRACAFACPRAAYAKTSSICETIRR